MLKWLFDRTWSAQRTRPSGGPQAESAGRFTVRHGKRYRATVVLSFLQQLAATNEMIAGKLAEAGFRDVKVTGTGGTRMAEALWPGPDTTAPLPDELRDVTEIA